MSQEIRALEEDLNEEEDLAFANSEDIGDEQEGKLAIDVYQTDEAIVIESPIAAVASDDLEINITSESVSIKGKRERRSSQSSEDYFYQECYWGRFSRSIILPQEIDAEASEASIKNGVLVIRMPKLKKARQRRLKVQSE